MIAHTLLYKDAQADIDDRVQDLLARMTLEEKVAQLQAVFKDALLVRDDRGVEQFSATKVQAAFPHGLGRVSIMSHQLPLADHIRIYNELQRHHLEHTRLGIPVLVDCEGIHGCMAPGSTMYPHAIALASSWDPAFVTRVATAIGREVKARGNHQALSPVLDIARDARNGRVEETYGEDPLLVSRMGVAFITGVQSQGIACTPKHFIANFVADGGRDSHPIHLNERLLREIYFPPFEAAVRDAGALGIMCAYNSYDGRPCAANTWLLKDVLKDEWGFKGAVVSDWGAVNGIADHHKVTDDYAGCAAEAITNGMDLEQPFNLCFKYLLELAQSGRVSVEAIDDAVSRLLYVKFWTGLFDNPYFAEETARANTNTPECCALAREAARRGLVLLKNDGILPLAKTLATIAVIGPHAAVGRIGSYSHDDYTAVSPLEGITSLLGGAVEILHHEGCPINGDDASGIAEAAALAAQADAVVFCVGNNSGPLGGGPEYSEGEQCDRTSLDLPGVQEQLLHAVVAANPNTVVVLVGGHPVTMQRWIGAVRAILVPWYAGQEGGHAIAEALFGDLNPSGKLPITYPKVTGQCPLYYNAKPHGRANDYIDLRGPQAQFPFGHGLSYTTFEYSDLQVATRGEGEALTVSIAARITNTGDRAGAEVVQLYLRDEVSLLARPVKELKGFQRVALQPGASVTVAFTLGWRDLAYLGPDLQPTLEPGNLIFMLGSSSDDIRLRYETDPNLVWQLTDFTISPMLPPVEEIASVTLPDATVPFTPFEALGAGLFTLTNLTSVSADRHGVIYIKAHIDLPRGGHGLLRYSADAPVKVWINGEVADCQPWATPPVSPNEFSVAASWLKGHNDILFVISTDHGHAWGVCANVTL